MTDNNFMKNFDFTSPSNIIIIMLIFIIIMLIFQRDSFSNNTTLIPSARPVTLPMQVNQYIMFNHIPSSKLLKIKWPYIVLRNQPAISVRNISIFIVCAYANLYDRSPYCLLDLGCISINRNNVTINNIPYKYSTTLNLLNTTVLSCIITNGIITVTDGRTLYLNNNLIDEQSTSKQKYPVKVSIGQLYNNNMMDTTKPTNIFNGKIHHVLMYNTALNSIMYNKVLMYLMVYHRIPLDMNFNNQGEINNNSGEFTWL